MDLDHLIVPARDKIASARQLAELLSVPWAPRGVGPFAPVFVNTGLTLDFDQTEGEFPKSHYCFRLSELEFDHLLSRLRTSGVAYRSSSHGPVDMKVNTEHGGRIVYWSEPDGHYWEALTVSYARQASQSSSEEPNDRAA